MDQHGEILLGQALHEIFRNFNTCVEINKHIDKMPIAHAHKELEGGQEYNNYYPRFQKIIDDAKMDNHQ